MHRFAVDDAENRQLPLGIRRRHRLGNGALGPVSESPEGFREEDAQRVADRHQWPKEQFHTASVPEHTSARPSSGAGAQLALSGAQGSAHPGSTGFARAPMDHSAINRVVLHPVPA